MLSPVRLKKFHLVVAKRHETQILEEIASLDAAQLIDARDVVAGEAEGFDAYDRYLRMVQRCSALQGTVSALRRRYSDVLPPPRAVRQGPPRSARITQSEIRRALDQY